MNTQIANTTQAAGNIAIFLIGLLCLAQPAYADRGHYHRHVEDWRAPRQYSNNYHRPARYRHEHRHSYDRPAPRRYFSRQYAWEPVYYQSYIKDCDSRLPYNYYRYRR